MRAERGWTDPDAILDTIGDSGAIERVVHESGPLSIWLTRELTKRGAPIVCIDARAAHKALSARIISQIVQTQNRWRNWPGPVGIAKFTSRAKKAID